MVFQVTLSPGEAKTIREAATRAQVTTEEFLRGAILLYLQVANDPYFREGADRPRPRSWQPTNANIGGDAGQIAAFQETLRREGEKAFRAGKQLELACQTNSAGYVTNVVLQESDGAGVLVFDFTRDGSGDGGASVAKATTSRGHEEPGGYAKGFLARAPLIGKLLVERCQRVIDKQRRRPRND